MGFSKFPEFQIFSLQQRIELIVGELKTPCPIPGILYYALDTEFEAAVGHQKIKITISKLKQFNKKKYKEFNTDGNIY